MPLLIFHTFALLAAAVLSASGRTYLGPAVLLSSTFSVPFTFPWVVSSSKLTYFPNHALSSKLSCLIICKKTSASVRKTDVKILRRETCF